MKLKLRQIIAIVLILSGVSIFLYGQFASKHSVWSKEGDEDTTTAEKDIVKEVTIHGVVRADEGKLARTYSTREGAAPPPDDCPT